MPACAQPPRKLVRKSRKNSLYFSLMQGIPGNTGRCTVATSSPEPGWDGVYTAESK
jgi:hypothetical protein